MPKSDRKAIWWASMIEKYGSEEAVREHQKNSGIKGKKTGKGGFAYMKKNDPIRLRRVAAAGGYGKRGYKKEYESEISQS